RLDEAIALLRAEVAMRQGTKVTLHVDGLDRRDRALDTDIPIRWGLRLCAETEPPRLREQAPFPGVPAGDEPQLPSRRVGIPDRHRQRSPAPLGNTDDPDLPPPQKRLALEPGHGQRHMILLRSVVVRHAVPSRRIRFSEKCTRSVNSYGRCSKGVDLLPLRRG